MTNNNPIATALAPLTNAAANHIRIHTAVAEGKRDQAISLLETRMEGILQGYAEGDVIEDERLLTTLRLLDATPGLVVRNAIHIAADIYIDIP